VPILGARPPGACPASHAVVCHLRLYVCMGQEERGGNSRQSGSKGSLASALPGGKEGAGYETPGGVLRRGEFPGEGLAPGPEEAEGPGGERHPSLP
jgi:hypothetical protein